MFRLKRVYDEPSDDDGVRVLVDRLWPRGLSKEKARVDVWLKDAAPSPGLRGWFSHDPAKWERFKKEYGDELRRLEREHGTVTLLYAARSGTYNHARVLLGSL